jgi:hypothetical protein
MQAFCQVKLVSCVKASYLSPENEVELDLVHKFLEIIFPSIGLTTNKPHNTLFKPQVQLLTWMTCSSLIRLTVWKATLKATPPAMAPT